MTEPERIDVREASARLKSGTALLVCAYDDEGRFKALHLEGAISLREPRSRLGSLPKDQEIIFYCA